MASKTYCRTKTSGSIIQEVRKDGKKVRWSVQHFASAVRHRMSRIYGGLVDGKTIFLQLSLLKNKT